MEWNSESNACTPQGIIHSLHGYNSPSEMVTAYKREWDRRRKEQSRAEAKRAATEKARLERAMEDSEDSAEESDESSGEEAAADSEERAVKRARSITTDLETGKPRNTKTNKKEEVQQLTRGKIEALIHNRDL